jgi:pSer/pThr/pTyr-binding forkhead associated (FHA) protein
VALRDGLLIGRSRENDIVVRDARASRQHARIAADGTGFVIEDLGSSNGTFVNGQRVERALLGADATVTIGNTHLRLRTDAG